MKPLVAPQLRSSFSFRLNDNDLLQKMLGDCESDVKAVPTFHKFIVPGHDWTSIVFEGLPEHNFLAKSRVAHQCRLEDVSRILYYPTDRSKERD